MTSILRAGLAAALTASLIHPAYAQWEGSIGPSVRNVTHTETAPGGRRLVKEDGWLPGVALQADGKIVIVGTSADETLVQGLLKIADAEDILTEYTTSSDVEASKPEPDIVQAAVSKLGLEPGEVLMVGDTPFDVESARKAGVDTVALRCGGDDRFEGAVVVYDSPEDWLKHLDEVPLGAKVSQ